MDPQLLITLDQDGTAFQPGQMISGSARWLGVENIKKASVRLFHTTSGIGTTDTVVVAEHEFNAPQADGNGTFSFTLPAAPPSFSGKLITLAWGVELVIHPGGHGRAIMITVGPDRREIRLPQVAPAAGQSKWWKPKH